MKEITIKDDEANSFILARPYGPTPTRKNLYLILEIRNELCRKTEFQNDIKQLQNAFPAGYWADRERIKETQRKFQRELISACNEIAKALAKKYLVNPSQLHTHFKSEEQTSPSLSQSLYLKHPTIDDAFSVEADKFCFKWGLIDFHETTGTGRMWLAWAVQNWDLEEKGDRFIFFGDRPCPYYSHSARTSYIGGAWFSRNQVINEKR